MSTTRQVYTYQDGAWRRVDARLARRLSRLNQRQRQLSEGIDMGEVCGSEHSEEFVPVSYRTQVLRS